MISSTAQQKNNSYHIILFFFFLVSVSIHFYFYNNKKLNMNFITMKWVFEPWGEIVVWIWICKTEIFSTILRDSFLNIKGMKSWREDPCYIPCENVFEYKHLHEHIYTSAVMISEIWTFKGSDSDLGGSFFIWPDLIWPNLRSACTWSDLTWPDLRSDPIWSDLIWPKLIWSYWTWSDLMSGPFWPDIFGPDLTWSDLACRNIFPFWE